MLDSQIHHQKCQEPLKKYQAIHPNSVCNRILVRHFLFIYLFIYFQFRFVISIFKNPQLRNIKYVRSEERCTSVFQRDIKIPRIYKCSVAQWLTFRLGLGRDSVGKSVRIPVKSNKENMKFLRSLFFLILFTPDRWSRTNPNFA